MLYEFIFEPAPASGSIGARSASGHSRPSRASLKSGHVRYAAESGSKFRALAATP
jgi:hypothetical protein